MKKSEESRVGWYFLLAVFIILIIAIFLDPNILLPTLKFTYSIFFKILPIFILVFILLVIFNFLITPKSLVKYMGKESGAKGWIIAVVTGIVSTGPIYMWYPLLNELQKAGVRTGFLATFLYNRAIKPALLPMIIFYFGLNFTIILTIVMIVVSIFQGMLVEKIVEVKI